MMPDDGVTTVAMDEIRRRIHSSVVRSSHFLGNTHDIAAKYLDSSNQGLHPLVRFVSAQLFLGCHLTSESILLLLDAGKEWDAEILCRSILEGTVKQVYLLHGQPDEVLQKAIEFWEIMPEFSAIKRSEKAKSALAHFSYLESIEAKPFHDVVVSDDEVAAAKERYSKSQRKIIEERWSFQGIEKYFQATNEPGLNALEALGHGYGISSHLLHKDGVAMGVIWDRFNREPVREAAITWAHASRLMSDVCSFATLRLFRLLKACSADTGCIDDLQAVHSPLFEEFRTATRYFNNIEFGHQEGNDGC